MRSEVYRWTEGPAPWGDGDDMLYWLVINVTHTQHRITHHSCYFHLFFVPLLTLFFPVLLHLLSLLESLWTMTSCCRTATATAPPTLTATSGTVSPSLTATPPTRAGPPVTTAGCRWPSPRCLCPTCLEPPDGFTVSESEATGTHLLSLWFIDPSVYLLSPRPLIRSCKLT